MDAVLEPFPADRLFPGSSFLDLGDLNESDFLNNAVRTKGSRFPYAHNSHPSPRSAWNPAKTRKSQGGGSAQGSLDEHVVRVLRWGD